MTTEKEYLENQKNSNKDSALIALKSGAVRRDNKGRAYYYVSTQTRRNNQMIIPQSLINSFLKNNDIDQLIIDNIRPY